MRRSGVIVLLRGVQGALVGDVSVVKDAIFITELQVLVRI